MLVFSTNLLEQKIWLAHYNRKRNRTNKIRFVTFWTPLSKTERNKMTALMLHADTDGSKMLFFGKNPNDKKMELMSVYLSQNPVQIFCCAGRDVSSIQCQF